MGHLEREFTSVHKPSLGSGRGDRDEPKMDSVLEELTVQGEGRSDSIFQSRTRLRSFRKGSILLWTCLCRNYLCRPQMPGWERRTPSPCERPLEKQCCFRSGQDSLVLLFGIGIKSQHRNFKFSWNSWASENTSRTSPSRRLHTQLEKV